MTAPAFAPVSLKDLEAVEEAVCVNGDGPATWRIRHDKCSGLLCDKCSDIARTNLTIAAERHKTLWCGRCGMDPVNPATVIIREA